jgi:hypothetical protein
VAYISKKDLIEKINPLYDELCGLKEGFEALLEEMDQGEFESLLDRMGRTLQDLRSTLDEAGD